MSSYFRAFNRSEVAVATPIWTELLMAISEMAQNFGRVLVRESTPDTLMAFLSRKLCAILAGVFTSLCLCNNMTFFLVFFITFYFFLLNNITVC